MFRPSLALACALLAFPAMAETSLHLDQQAQKTVPRDRLQAELRVEASGPDSRTVQDEVNRRMGSALAKARKSAALTVQSGGYSVYREQLPKGPVNVPIAEKFPLPDKLTTYNSMEGLIQHFELIMPNRGVDTPHDEVYAAVESPNGELGYYLVCDGSQTAWRVRTRPPSFIHFSVFPRMIKGLMLADAVAVLGSLNIIAAELDR